MLRIDMLRLRPGQGEADLLPMAAAALGVRVKEISHLTIHRRSIDARGGEVTILCSVRVSVKQERQVLKRCRNKRVSLYTAETYTPPKTYTGERPVIIGAGPAGLFCALALAEAGARPIVLERGKAVEDRQKDVEVFWRSGRLDPQSNVQFGEGGAGAFSDGKLTTGTRDKRHRYILEKLVELGAPPEILYDARPHVGTDRFFVVLQNLRRRLTDLGTEMQFSRCVTDFQLQNGHLKGLTVEAPDGAYSLPAGRVVLAVGHSARDTFHRLHSLGVAMEAKPFAVGVRIEHSQTLLSAAQYGQAAGMLPPASYKVSCHLPSGRGVFSFCVCPGGQVVAAASEQGGLVTNGMSYYARDGACINGGLLVGVTPADFGGTGPLAGIAFQRRLEAAAFAAGGGNGCAPVQLAGDFLAGRASAGPGTIVPTYQPGVTWTDLRQCLPDFVSDALAAALPLLEKQVKGFAAPDAVLTAVESRSSSPVRILRGEDGQSLTAAGLFPCGEGAGYAGGIMSAAADGLRTAEKVCGMEL